MISPFIAFLMLYDLTIYCFSSSIRSHHLLFFLFYKISRFIVFPLLYDLTIYCLSNAIWSHHLFSFLFDVGCRNHFIHLQCFIILCLCLLNPNQWNIAIKTTQTIFSSKQCTTSTPVSTSWRIMTIQQTNKKLHAPNLKDYK